MIEHREAHPLPTSGRVLGIDVGYSPHKRTTCFCVLAWSGDEATLSFRKTKSGEDVRRIALAELCADQPVLAVAVDGPLSGNLQAVRHYRSAEAILSQGVMQRRGKPGQTSSKVGQQLHQHATILAFLALETADILPACHQEAIHHRRVVEAFPTAFLAALLDDQEFAELGPLGRNKSDAFWERAVDGRGRLEALVRRWLPGRKLTPGLSAVRDHEHRAGAVCALTALAVVYGDFVAIGDPVGGDIVLPPLAVWGKNGAGRPWLRDVLQAALYRLRRDPRQHVSFQRARVHWGAPNRDGGGGAH